MEGMKNDLLKEQKQTFVHQNRQVEEVKQTGPVLAEHKQDEKLVQAIEKLDAVQEVKEEIKQGVAEVDVNKEKVSKANNFGNDLAEEIELKSFAEKYKEKEEGDSSRMDSVKQALKEFQLAQGFKNLSKIRIKTHELIEACKSYCFMRFSLFRSKKGKQRLADVKEILNNAKALEAQYNEQAGDSYAEFIADYKHTEEEKALNKGYISRFGNSAVSKDKYDIEKQTLAEEYREKDMVTSEALGIMAYGAAMFVGYNTVRAVGTAIALPFVGIYTGLSKLRQKLSKKYVHRPIDLSWKWKFRDFTTEKLYQHRREKERTEVEKEHDIKLDANKYKFEFRSDIEKRARLDYLENSLSSQSLDYTVEDGLEMVEEGIMTKEEFEALKEREFFRSVDPILMNNAQGGEVGA